MQCISHLQKLLKKETPLPSITAADGVAADGVAADGVAADGVAADGVAADGVKLNWCSLRVPTAQDVIDPDR